jgi:hypothetical protein
LKFERLVAAAIALAIPYGLGRPSEFGQNCEINVQSKVTFDYTLGGSRIGLA